MLFVLPMLRHSPNLVTFTLSFCYHEAYFMEREQAAIVHLPRLETLFFETPGRTHTYFLSRLRAPALKRMTIMTSRYLLPTDYHVASDDVAELVDESGMELEEVSFRTPWLLFRAIYPLISESVTKISGLSDFEVLNRFSRERSVCPSMAFPRLRFAALHVSDMDTLGRLVAVLDQLPHLEELVLETGRDNWEKCESLRLSGRRKIRFVERLDEPTSSILLR